MIYLDDTANTPVDPTVLAAFCAAETRYFGNPNADHPAGQAARAALARTTEAIARLLGVQPGEIIYTSGATEANDLAVKGLAQAAAPAGRHILTTALSHASVRGALDALRQAGDTVERVPVGADGKIDLAALRRMLRADTVLLSVCAVDSELGAVQPIEPLADLLSAYPNCRLHVDATQAVGKLPLTLAGVDAMSFAPHKFNGLNGVGILYKRSRVPLTPQIGGGAGATPYRSGTPALALAVSAEKALELALTHQAARVRAVRERNALLRAALLRYPAVRINSPADAVPHILNLSVRGVKGTTFQRALADRGVCVSVRSACSSDGAPSEAVLAVTGDRRNALSSWRISLSHLTPLPALTEFLQIFDACCKELIP